MRKPAGTGFCWAMISLTLATALAVRVTGGVFLVTSGTVVVAIRISLALKLVDYIRGQFPRAVLAGSHARGESPTYWMRPGGSSSHAWRLCSSFVTVGFSWRQPCQTGL